MGVKTALQLISLEFKTNKLVEIDKIVNDAESVKNTGTSRSFTIDINLKKTAALFGLWVGILNAHLPSEVWIFITKLAGN